MKRKSPLRRKPAAASARTAAAPAEAARATQPAIGREPGKMLEHAEPFLADEEERRVEDSPETDVAPDRLERNEPEPRRSSPDACGLAEGETVPGSDLD